MAKQDYILGIGAANIDIMGRSKRSLVTEDSNPGHIETSVGGATHNACENAARLGASVSFITATGDDRFSDIIRKTCADAGIDTQHFFVFPGCISSTYMSVHDSNGEMNIAVSDMSVLQNLTVEMLEEKRSLIEGAMAVTFDTGLPKSVIDYLLAEFGEKVPIFADPVSTTYAEKLLGSLKGIYTLKPNLLEAEILSGRKIKSAEDLQAAADSIISGGVKRVFISLGKQGIFYKDAWGSCLYRKTRPLDHIANATGAGDSFLGALLYAHTQKLSIEETLQMAMTVSALTIQSDRTINPDMSRQLVDAAMPLYQSSTHDSIDSIIF